MGFNYFSYGIPTPAWVSKSVLSTRLPSGAIVDYKTNLSDDLEIEEQRNFFSGETIAFLLKKDGMSYIGRFDGTISIVRNSDNLLYGLSNWDRPLIARVDECGLAVLHGRSFKCYLDNRDWMSIHAYKLPFSAYSAIQLYPEFQLYYSTSEYNRLKDEVDDETFIYGGDGRRVQTEKWIVPDVARWKNRRIFL